MNRSQSHTDVHFYVRVFYKDEGISRDVLNVLFLCFSEKCPINMVDKETDSSILTVISSRNNDEVQNALLQSTVPFSVPPQEGSSTVVLYLVLHSADTPLISSISFSVFGTSQIDYYFDNSGSTSGPVSPGQKITDPTMDILNLHFDDPVTADRLYITLTAASPDSTITVQNLFVKACINPGIEMLYCLQIHHHDFSFWER